MRTAIIFGATSGIGKTLAEMLVADGYQVAITGRRVDKLNELVSQYPNQVFGYVNDIQKSEEVEKVFYEILTKFQQIDLIVQSSGVAYINLELDWKKEEDTLLTNVSGVTQLYGLAYNLFKQQGYGHLVGISSIASLRGSRGAPAYFASKAYQKAYLESLYIKTKTIPTNQVIITDIRPGFVNTDMALGDGLFWVVPLEKATRQIYTAIQQKKRVAYISKRWRLIAWVLKLVPSWLLKKVT